MGSNRKLLFGVLFVVAGLVFWGLYSAVNRASESVTPVPVPVAAQPTNPNAGKGVYARAITDIPQGSIVTKEMIEMRPLGGGVTTTGAVTDVESQAVGYITRVPISKGALIRPADDFIGHITETGIAGVLRPGTRAMVIPFANKPTLHDLVRIGNFVDINAAFDGQEARTIVQNLRVIAVDVFINDFPEVNGAVRGPFKAEPKRRVVDSPPAAPGAAAPAAGAPAPDATPTPTPAPAQAPPRPDPSITLEVTPTQANTILLAQTSGGTIDFVVRPALPGGLSPDAILVDGGIPVSDTSGNAASTARITTTSAAAVTRAQIAPYAERRRAAGGNAGGGNRGGNTGGGSTGGGNRAGNTRTVSNNSSGSGGGNFQGVGRNTPWIPSGNVDPPANSGTKPPVIIGDSVPPPPAPPAPPSTYEIPIYADGKVVRTETVRRPLD